MSDQLLEDLSIMSHSVALEARDEIIKLKRRISELERVIEVANIRKLEQDAARWQKVKDVYSRYEDQRDDYDKYSLIADLGRLMREGEE